MCADAPNTEGINKAAVQTAALSKESLDWFKQTYADQAPQRDAAAALDTKVAESQLAGMNFATDQAKEAAARNKATFQPLEDRVVAGASAYDTPERRMAAANEAQASVEANFGRAQQGVTREIMRRGGGVDSPANASLMADAAIEKAKAVTGATAAATRNVESQGHARMMDAVGIGHGVVGNQATQQQIATSTGAAATGAAGAGIGVLGAGNALMSQGFSTAIGAQTQAGQLYGQAANASKTDNSALWGAVGSMTGTAAMFF